MKELLRQLHRVPSLANQYQYVPFTSPWKPYTSVQPVRNSFVNHTTVAISAYRKTPHLRLGGVRQWFIQDNLQLCKCHITQSSHLSNVKLFIYITKIHQSVCFFYNVLASSSSVSVENVCYNLEINFSGRVEFEVIQ